MRDITKEKDPISEQGRPRPACAFVQAGLRLRCIPTLYIDCIILIWCTTKPDCTDAQAVQGLQCLHMAYGSFSPEEPHLARDLFQTWCPLCVYRIIVLDNVE